MIESVEKIQNKIIDSLVDVCQTLRNQGFSDQDIQKYVRDHHKKKSFDFYKASNVSALSSTIKGVFEGIEKADSKIEKILFNLLTGEGIQFKFQYKIGFYRADYLLWGFLIVELDGPQHELQKNHDKKRDAYLKKMGYQVLRVPVHVLIDSPDEILELILSYKPKEKPKKESKLKKTNRRK